MFSTKNHPSAISNLNCRIERHGEDRVLAADLRLTVSVSSDQIDSIEPRLCESLFRAPGPGDQQPLIGPQSLTALKHPLLKPVQLSQEFTGYEATIANIGDGEGLFLADVKLKKFVIAPKEGGSAEISFTLSTEVDRDELADMAEFLVTEDVSLSLTPPKQSANDGTGIDQQCESVCGPATHFDSEGTPLCDACYDELDEAA